jgi:prepilin-type N-terminal cleavage/methylation domain-containing protein
VPGFTLIEVIGALLIFSVGVLMVIQVSGALGRQMRYAGARSVLAVYANQYLDSLEAAPFTSVAAGTIADTFVVEGMNFESTVTVASVTQVLKRIDVSIDPITGSGPSYSVTSYRSDAW